MKNRYISLILLSVTLLFSCQEKPVNKGLTLDDCPVIAHKVVVNSDTVIVCDVSLVRDTFNIQLMSLLDPSSFEIVHLENSEKALMSKTGNSAISENYIGLMSSMAGGYKLYTRDGKYLRDISSQGQGPNEYWISIYDSHIDEKNDRIYLASFRASKILVFDLQGKPQKHIPLSYIAHKGRFIVDSEKETVFVMALPFIDTPSAMWLQDFKGNILQEYPSTQFIINPGDYSNEIEFTFNTPEMVYSLFHIGPNVMDTVYHYDLENNRIKPVFTADFKNPCMHNYTELPNHYLVRFVFNTMPGTNHSHQGVIIVDKKTLKGCYVHFKLNTLGGLDMTFYGSPFNRGYYLENLYPHELKEELEKVLARKDKLTPEMYQKVKTFNNSIGEDDNNILFIGKLKQ